MARPHRSKEAIRLGTTTWRFARGLEGKCADCRRCDNPDRPHHDGGCRLDHGWFAGEDSLCRVCFAERIRAEVGQEVVEEVVILASAGDPAAVSLVGRSLASG